MKLYFLILTVLFSLALICSVPLLEATEFFIVGTVLVIYFAANDIDNKE